MCELVEMRVSVRLLQGLKVVRMAAKSRESIGSSVEHLTLHHQVFQYCPDPFPDIPV